MKHYLTTAIPYVNGVPHIGHALDYLLADTCARYLRLQGNEVRFQAGTDEHGNKIFDKATEQGLPVQEFVNKNAKVFQDFIAALGVEYTDFIRTTNEAHMVRCQDIWRRLEPHIYKSTYSGWYCTGCEGYATDTEYKDHEGVCPDHQKPYVKLSEENYYLRISDFKAEIAEAIKSRKMQILPDFRAKELLKLLESSPDVSISRPKSSLKWGIPVPDDDEQVMYVWIDALANYITVLGYPENEIEDFWPASAQFVGKDILRFHAIIWPAILLALGLPLPKVIHSHGHVLSNGNKMSKSLGNVVDPMEVLEVHGVDAFRYFFLRHIDTFADSDFTWEKYHNAYNNELANDYGNLVQRLATLAQKNQLPAVDFLPAVDPDFEKLMNEMHFSRAIDYLWGRLTAINQAIDQKQPWALAKQGQTEALHAVLGELIGELLQVNRLLSPFMPETAEKVLGIFTEKTGIVPPETPLFPKIRARE